MATRAQSLLDGFGFAQVPGKRIGAWMATVALAFTGDQARRRARHELAMLDDRMLRDMGISRTEIDYVVRHGR